MFTRPEYLLVKPAEEAAEVIQRVQKALVFGLDEVQPGQELNNAARLMHEWADLLGVMGMLFAGGIVPPVDWERVAAKPARVEEYMRISRERGIVE